MSRLLRPAERVGHRLDELFGDLPGVSLPASSVSVDGITLDSRTVQPGDLYIALPGTRAHGADYCRAAAELGAVAVLTDDQGADRARSAGLPVVVADDPRAAMARAAATLFGRPTHELLMFGLTGTNGKTTTCFLVEAGLVAAGRRVGTIGTIGFRLDGEPLESSRTTVTTPESPDLQALMAVLLERGADAVAMEVSSHALALQRVNEVGFDVAGFTNLGRDHLDFHPSMEHYFETKARLFEPDHCRVAVVTVDDDHGKVLAARIAERGAPRLVTTGFEPSDYQILSWRPQPQGALVHCTGPFGEREFPIALPGEFNVRNAVLALAMLTEGGIDPDQAIKGLATAQVPGRMQVVPLTNPDVDDAAPDRAPTVIVDFAHTPQAIAAALQAVQPGLRGRVIVVLGAGGDRDHDKRGPMGRAAAEAADLVVVTDDNPRTEDPTAIRQAVAEGARLAGRADVVVVSPRQQAIATALREAGPDDLVLVLGKGHERGQEVAGQVLEFDDLTAVQQAWRELREQA